METFAYDYANYALLQLHMAEYWNWPLILMGTSNLRKTFLSFRQWYDGGKQAYLNGSFAFLLCKQHLITDY